MFGVEFEQGQMYNSSLKDVKQGLVWDINFRQSGQCRSREGGAGVWINGWMKECHGQEHWLLSQVVI